MATATASRLLDLPAKPEPIALHRLSVRLPADSWDALKSESRARGRTASEVVRHLIDTALSETA